MKFTSAPVAEHEETPLADGGQWEELVSRWETRHERDADPDHRGACYVVSVAFEKGDHSRQLEEITGLVETQGGRVAGREVVVLRRPDPRTLLGKGTAASVAERAQDAGAELLIVDADLSPSQMRNLEDATGFAVSDREAIILNVFLMHAQTRRARIQVEIAQLEYLRPRIRGLGLEMDQQVGGNPHARGPGETASELRARQLDGRLSELKRALVRLERADATQRRRRSDTRRIALVGYTNAGKTSLMNALASTELSARNVPFETLDTTSRCLTRHGGEVLLSDTVGFIRRLPERLLASFESTLAEIREASLLVLVVDVSDPERHLHLATTERLLERLDAAALPRVYVFNKIDRLESSPSGGELAMMAGAHSYAVLSTRDEEAVRAFRERLIEAVRGDRTTLFVPYEDEATIRTVYARCRVIEVESTETGLSFVVEANPSVLARLQGRSA